ncbi:MAG: hypothetical protein KTR32_38250, partial [Granulosicoccus sp.]|nr:hypothetical protein [Granulosicoccus sp.]
MAKKILLMLLLLSAGNVKAVQLCDCHVMCEAINQLDHYKANKQHFKFLKLADRGWFFRSEVDLGSFEEFDQKGYKKFTELLKFLKAKNVRFSIVNLPPR